MSQVPICPQCQSAYSYEDRDQWVCSECNHTWSGSAAHTDAEQATALAAVRDAHGNVLHDGDSVTVVKDLKVKGSSSVVKVGTKVRNIRLIEGADDHNIACKIDGIGSMNLKSEFVKKS